MSLNISRPDGGVGTEQALMKDSPNESYFGVGRRGQMWSEAVSLDESKMSNILCLCVQTHIIFNMKLGSGSIMFWYRTVKLHRGDFSSRTVLEDALVYNTNTLHLLELNSYFLTKQNERNVWMDRGLFLKTKQNKKNPLTSTNSHCSSILQQKTV